MRFLINVLFLILMSPVLSFGQIDQYELRFEHVDHHVSQVDKKFIFHPQLLSQNLSEGLTNDYDKVRAFYVWIARNIDYDLLAYVNKTRSGQSINQVMRSGKALCSGFSLLFNYFCQEAGIESVIIEGYAKGHGYRKNQQFEEVNHAWNAVKIYERWYLLDATWAIGNPTNINDLAEAIHRLLMKKEYGVFHIAGNEICSRLEFALKIAEIFDLDPGLIQEITSKDLSQKAPRPMNSSFNLNKLSNAIDWLPGGLNKSLERLRSQQVQ